MADGMTKIVLPYISLQCFAVLVSYAITALFGSQKTQSRIPELRFSPGESVHLMNWDTSLVYMAFFKAWSNIV